MSVMHCRLRYRNWTVPRPHTAAESAAKFLTDKKSAQIFWLAESASEFPSPKNSDIRILH